MQQRRALGHASRATRVLQKRDIVRALLDGLETLAATLGDRRVEFDVTRQAPRRHHLLHAPHDEVHQRALHAHQIAHCGDNDVLDRRVAHDRLQRDSEVFEQDDRFRATVLELVLELPRGVERIHIHHHVARAQDRRNRDRILQHVRHHDRNARAAGKALRLKPRGKLARERVELAVADLLTHADERRFGAVFAEGFFEQFGDGRIAGRVDLCGNAGRIRFQPDFVHAASPPLFSNGRAKNAS